MSQQRRSVKQTNVQTQAAAGQHIEHTEVFDDNLLPDAVEIEKLCKIDPTILDWLKARAEKEQDFRHNSFTERAKIISRNEHNNRVLNVVGLICAFIIFCGGMAIGGFLIYKGHNITGTLFCGGTLLSAAGLFINRQNKVRVQNKPTKTP